MTALDLDYAKLEPEADKDLPSNMPVDTVLLYSIAVSLRKITRGLDTGDLFRGPVNAYGETFTDAIQNGLVRGQRGIETP